MKRFFYLLCAFLFVASLGLFGAGKQEAKKEEAAKPAVVKEGKYSEAPMLAAKVKAGELPSVDKRLPEEPMVLKTEEIGVYGGTWSTPKDMSWIGSWMSWIWEHLFVLEVDPGPPAVYGEPTGNIIRDWEFNKDATECTFYMRKGMKWSDGHPFTSDDFVFWYEDVILNNELTPVKPAWLMAGGKLGVLEKIDEYTIKWKFAAPYGFFIQTLCTGAGYYASKPIPAHYLKQFHPKYAKKEDLEKLMKGEGSETWMDLFNKKGLGNSDLDNPDRPTLYAWRVLNGPRDPVQFYERNPYYWKVDAKGNQLPYIDKADHPLYPNMEAILLDYIAGKLDFQPIWYMGGAKNYTILMQNAAKGNYRRIGRSTAGGRLGNTGTIFLNPHQDDPVIRDLFANLKFRQALSVALDREEVNRVLFNGLMVPSQLTPPYGSPFHGEDDYWRSYAQHNPELANKLLDEIGLSRGKDGYRLRPDGKPLVLAIHPLIGYPAESTEMAELYRQHWDKVGIKTVVKPLDDKLWFANSRAGKGDIYMRASGFSGNNPLSMYEFPVDPYFYPGPLWGRWFATGGKEGEEPPAFIKRLKEISNKILAEVDRNKRDALFMEAYRIHIDNLLEIGVLSSRPEDSPADSFFFSNRLGNVLNPFHGDVFHDQVVTWFIRP